MYLHCVARFDDAYFLEPEAVESASKGGAPDAPNPGVSAARGGPGVDGEDSGDIAKVTAVAAAVPGVPFDGGDGGTSSSGRTGVLASREGSCAKRQGPQRDKGGGGRGRGVEAGEVVARPVDATAAEREKNSRDCVEIGIGGAEDQHKRDSGIICQARGVNERARADGTPGDIAVEDPRPTAAWTSSKRPRKEEIGSGAVA